MPKKNFTAETTAAAELFNAPAQPTASKKEKPEPKKAQAPAEPDYIVSWKARPDGEPRSRRIQIVSKPSIAKKAADLARERGISLAYLFENLVSAEWERANKGNKGNK